MYLCIVNTYIQKSFYEQFTYIELDISYIIKQKLLQVQYIYSK